MRRILRHRLLIAGVVVAFAAGGGAAYAATQSSSNPRQAFVNDVAKRLHVSPRRLTSAIKAAEIDRLNAAVKAGRMTQAQASAIKHAIESKGPPFVPGGGPGPFRRPPGPFGGPPGLFGGGLFFGRDGPVAAAAGYLGLSVPQLFNELRSGRSVAQIAKARGKSVSGLERAVTAAIKSKLDRAVASGRLTKSQEQQLLRTLSARLGDLVNHTSAHLKPPRGGPSVAPFPQTRSSMAPPF